MEERPPAEPDEPRDADPGRRDAAARRGDLARMAEAGSDATWGDGERGRTLVPGVLTGDIGAKGRVAAQLRALSRSERATYGEVPRGAVVPGSGRYLLLPLLLIAVALIGVVALLAWLVS